MIPASMAGAFKAYLEAQGLGVAVYRDGAPADDNTGILVAYPFVVVTEGVAYGLDSDAAGDNLPPGRAVILEAVQVDLWQQARSVTGPSGRATASESYTLPERIAAALRSPALGPFCAWHVYGVTLMDARRFPPSNGLVRHTWTPVVRRTEARKDTAA